MYFFFFFEDDDLLLRVFNKNITVMRNQLEIGRYKMKKHEIDLNNEPNENRHLLLENSEKRQMIDGLSNLKFKLLETTKSALFTRFLVSYREADFEYLKN